MTILPDRADERVDACIARLAPGISRSAAQRLCEDGQVLLNGAAAKKNARVAPGDVLELTLPEPQPTQAQAEDIPLDVAYEDADVIVINKPKGLVVHPAAGHWEGTLVNALLHHCRDSLSGVGGALRPGIVHRIDKDTSGLLIVAKNDFAHQKLAAQLQDHTLARTYVCIVCGKLREDAGTVNAPIARDKNDRKKMAVRPDGKPAAVSYTHLTSHHIRVETLDALVKDYVRKVRDNSSAMLELLNADLEKEQADIAETKRTEENLEALLLDKQEELKATKRQRIRDIMKHPEQEELLEETYDELEAELTQRIAGIPVSYTHLYRAAAKTVGLSTTAAFSRIKKLLPARALDFTEVTEDGV